MRGEHGAGASPMTVTSDGSSPHAWGTRCRDAPSLRHRRFIPTCVGNTPSTAAPDDRATVHPHMRGEHAASCQRLHRPVHPHMRGEHTLSRSHIDLDTGSSPHAWGTPVRPDACPLKSGSSPHAWGTLQMGLEPCWRAILTAEHLPLIPPLGSERCHIQRMIRQQMTGRSSCVRIARRTPVAQHCGYSVHHTLHDVIWSGTGSSRKRSPPVFRSALYPIGV